jgi:hypothetical protein
MDDVTAELIKSAWRLISSLLFTFCEYAAPLFVLWTAYFIVKANLRPIIEFLDELSRNLLGLARYLLLKAPVAI